MPGSNGDDGSLALPDSGIGFSTNGDTYSVNGNPAPNSIVASIINAGGNIAQSLINQRSVADQMKFSARGSNGFLYTSAYGPVPATVGIGSTTLILIAVAAVAVLFLFTRRAGG